MRPRERHELPDERRSTLRRAKRLEWATLVAMASVVLAIGLTMGSSQAMKAAWVEDLLSLVPPIAFLVAVRFHRRPPDEDFPFGHHRAMGISFLIAATALLAFGLFILIDSVLTLVRREHATIGTMELFGHSLWAGWVMIAALVYSMIVPILLGRMKAPLARELHDKTLHADAAMNRADWMTGGAAILGILGIGVGWWWADPVAAGIIGIDVTRDGVIHLKRVIGDLMDHAPRTLEGEPDPLPERVRERLEALPWVTRAAVRLREEGQVLVGEAFVVPAEGSDLPARLDAASELVQSLHWRLYEVVVTAVPALPPVPGPSGTDRSAD